MNIQVFQGLLQDEIDKKEALLLQYKDVATRGEIEELAQQATKAEKAQVDKQIDDYQNKYDVLCVSNHGALYVCIMLILTLSQTEAGKGAEARLKADNDKSYYSGKIREAQAKVDAAKMVEDQVQIEFTVRACPHLGFPAVLTFLSRSGLRRLSSTASAYQIRASLTRSKGIWIPCSVH